jgi:hypothetical protein
MAIDEALEPAAASAAAAAVVAAPAAADPSEETIRTHVKDIVDTNDLSQLSLKTVRRELEQRLGLPENGLDKDKKLVKEIVTAEIQRKQEEDADQQAVGTMPPPNNGPSPQAKAEKAADKKKTPEKGEKGTTKKRQLDMMTKSEFLKQAEEVTVQIGSKKMKLVPRQFSTGSSGYYSSGKVEMPCGDRTIMVQCSINCTVIGSKTWAE